MVMILQIVVKSITECSIVSAWGRRRRSSFGSWIYSWIVILTVVLQSACAEGPACGNEIINEAAAPDNKHIATVFERNCGATTDYSRIVAVRAVDQQFMPDNADQYVLTVSGRYPISISWTDSTQLQIAMSVPAKNVFVRRESWDGVRIKYAR